MPLGKIDSRENGAGMMSKERREEKEDFEVSVVEFVAWMIGK